MLRQTDALFGPCDILIMAAAVSDWRPRVQAAQKVKKGATTMTVEFEATPDILGTLSARRRPDQFLVGFAAETEAIEQHALEKLERKNLDLIVANSVAGPQGAFGSEQNRVILLGREGWRQVLGPAPKTEIARALIAQLDQAMKNSSRTP